MLLFLVLNEAQHVSGDTPPIIRNLKLHQQPLVLHTWKAVGRAVVVCCHVAYTLPDNIIVKFLQRKTKQDATVYQNAIIPRFK